MEDASKNGAGPKTKREMRAVTTVRRDGREPMDLGAAIGALITERSWELPAAGAELREPWAAIAPSSPGTLPPCRTTRTPAGSPCDRSRRPGR
ncbi:hypothetical protein OG728_02130 [Streptomyces microflavus]|uniref:hypothetical protein n=1 Tax=Streptomyces microflavus TaxID=1919 RepID=UPI002E123AD4|nr:hypothetical protein OG728_02130 [Streptomyces microflavus]